jgi:hypothetical protein
MSTRRTEPPASDTAPPVVHEVLRSPGRPLDAETHSTVGESFGYDFSEVRIHDDARAGESARSIGATAYTVGHDVVLDSAAVPPATPPGRAVLAHELAHVVQQRGAVPGEQLQVAPASDPAEREAATAAEQVGFGEALTTLSAAATQQRLVVQRLVARAGTVAPVDLTEYREMLARYRALLGSGQVTPEDAADVQKAIDGAEAKIRESERLAGRGQSMASLAGSSLVLTGGLAADDVTGIGVADDVAIPFTLLAAAAFGIAALALTASLAQRQEANRAAAEAVKEAISKIGQIVLAAQVGQKIRGLTSQIIIHLARILGTTVGGQPPDHQQDPNRDRNHWWKEIKNFLQQIADQGLSPKQLLRELGKEWSPETLAEIREALRRAAELMGEDPPDFPPAMP